MVEQVRECIKYIRLIFNHASIANAQYTSSGIRDARCSGNIILPYSTRGLMNKKFDRNSGAIGGYCDDIFPL